MNVGHFHEESIECVCCKKQGSSVRHSYGFICLPDGWFMETYDNGEEEFACSKECVIRFYGNG